MVGPYGAITWWGFSPALDLQNEYKRLDVSARSKEPINILLVGCGDCRHLLKTLAKTYKWEKTQLNVYVVENNLELFARHLLLLGIALESKEKLGLQEKCELFLELLGNSLIRPQTCDYLKEKANEYIRMVTDLDYMERNFPLIDMSLLKFKERDLLEGIFKFWRNTNGKLFDIAKCWDLRLRNYLEVRYDHRNNIYDWDYNMTLHKKADIIRFQEYKVWRDQGVAFELREDASYEVTNRSLASGLVVTKGSEKYGSRGFWGDIINSPYLAFGIECDDKSLFEKKNDVYIKSARDISVHNVTSFMHELMYKEKYEPVKERAARGKKEHPRIQEVIEEVEELQVAEEDNVKAQEEACIQTEGVKVHFLPLNCVPDLQKKSKYKQLFDLVYFSNSMVHFLTPELKALFSQEAMLIIETTKFMLDLKEDQSKEYFGKISAMAQRAGFQPLGSCDAVKDAFAYFKFTG
ncbi:dynein assembly factor 3, axonemal-like [Dendronephthya gigantea]|uniref:dynein assembly factor 3, axonemal-like n=1 Tax=Dendronephthya gigantea TaxID=151771 RepID=UPI00106D767B|nr:dynein assembly factor 3, axonemal-like [Dendronephthya gigantea]